MNTKRIALIGTGVAGALLAYYLYIKKRKWQKPKVRDDLELVAADEQYWEAIRQIRNDNRESFTNSHIIEKEEHWNFMRKHHGTYRVCLENGECIGFIGHVNKDVRLAVASSKKRQGVGTFMFSEMVKVFGKEGVPIFDVLKGRILPSNNRCWGWLKSLGYVPGNESSDAAPTRCVPDKSMEASTLWITPKS